MGKPPAPSPALNTLFASLLERTQSALRGFVRGMVGSSDQAADVVQDVFVDAWRAAQRGVEPFQGDGDELAIRRWLFHVAYRKAVSALRHDSVLHVESLDKTPVPEPSRFYEPMPFDDLLAEGDALCKALAELEPQDSAYLLLSVVQGFTAVEIASILDITPPAAKMRVWRAKQRLRDAYFAASEGQRTGVRR
ncbi:MAG TPA: sigma-70 family RNA polymerase sigma factor [Ktedonobacterales bacterium]